MLAVLLQAPHRGMRQAARLGEIHHRPVEQGPGGAQMVPGDGVLQALVRADRHGGMAADRVLEAATPEIGPVQVPDRHRENPEMPELAVGETLVGRALEERPPLDPLRGRRLEGAPLLRNDQEIRIGADLLEGEAVDLGDRERDFADAIEAHREGRDVLREIERALAPPLLLPQARQLLPVAHVERRAVEGDGAPLRREPDLHRQRQGANRAVRPDHPHDDLARDMPLPDIGQRRHQVPILRVDQTEQQVIARLRGIRHQTEQPVESRRPDLLPTREDPAPRTAHPTTFRESQELSRRKCQSA